MQQLQQITTKDFFSRTSVKDKFTELLGSRAPQFITSVLQAVASNEQLSKADPSTIYHAAATAATMDLPINSNLGFAYIVPYGGKNGVQAQFQIGYKGFIQLAQRSGQFSELDARPVYEGQYIEDDSLRGYHFKWLSKTSNIVIGYMAYFKLINGFNAILYMDNEELKRHGLKYSQTFKKGFGKWKEDFEGMARKTVIKLLLSRYAPLSIELQKAVITDQSIITDSESNTVEYVDASHETLDSSDVAEQKEIERILQFIQEATSIEKLDGINEFVPEELKELYMSKYNELKN